MCAKPLAPEAVLEKPALSQIRPAVSPTVRLSKMAVASLILSFFSLIVPFGIAAIVLGHTSRNRIAKSGGRLSGTGVAFAGLILGCLMAPIGALLSLGAISSVFQFNQELNKHPDARAALAARIENGDPYKKVSVENSPLYQQYAVQALTMIRDRQTEYMRTHPGEGYACRLSQIGEPLNPDSELGKLIAYSHYFIGVERCGTATKLWYTVLASPRPDYSSYPTYCMDSTGSIYKYRPDQVHDVIGRIIAVKPELCPRFGERVEQ